MPFSLLEIGTGMCRQMQRWEKKITSEEISELCAGKPPSLGEGLTNPVTFGPWRPFGVTSQGG